MKYDFETLRKRQNTGSLKWEIMYEAVPELSDDIVPFSVADMEIITAPEITEGMKNYLDTGILGYTMPTDEYYEAVCGWMKKRHDWEITKEQIVTFGGVVPAVFNAVAAYTEVGDGVIVMPPVYYPFYKAVETNNRVVVQNPLVLNGDKYEIDFADLEEKAKDPKNKLLILCSPHNPVGRVWTKEELEKLGRICIDNNVVIVSDEIHFDLILPGNTHTVFANISEEFAQHSIICTAPSKTFNLAGMQTSNIIIKNEALRTRFNDAQGEIGHMLNALGYIACRYAYNEAGGWLDSFLEVLDTNRKLVENFMAEKIPQIKVLPLQGTYLQWWDCRALNMSDEDMENFMQEKANIFFDEGYIFGDGGSGFERINLACPTWVLQAALNRLYEALKAEGIV